MSVNLTTVGLGDITPNSQLARLAQLVLLPLGLVVLGFVFATLVSFSNSVEPSNLPSRARDQLRLVEQRNAKLEKGADGKVDMTEFLAVSQERWLRFTMTPYYLALVIFAKYVLVLFVGSAFFLFDAHERKQQRLEAAAAGYNQGSEEEGDMTVVDCLFFATVVATSVGYGHRLVPHSDSAKAFLTVFVLVAVAVVAKLLEDMANLVYYRKEKEVAAIMIDSCTWVHKVG
jgi:hypothetical protein